MIQIDINELLKTGQINGFEQKSTKQVIVDRLGQPEEVEDYGNAGEYFHYGDIRLLFEKQELREVTVFYLNTDLVNKLIINDEWFSIKRDTGMSKFILILNLLKVRWQVLYDRSQFEYVILQLESGAQVVFYLEDDLLERISIHWW